MVASLSGSSTTEQKVDAKAPQSLQTVVKLHPAVARFPAPKKSGNDTQDQDAETRFFQLQKMVTWLLHDDQDVVFLYSALEKRIASRASSFDLDFKEFAMGDYTRTEHI